ncbi:type II toxin-antitoxin system HicB family antitoxin [Sansalvadorimonas verongulae]|uniref:type II toxin-antitoxin system HicB family antitoxin n=1 Tax=Sansalvadorimonas verongulae TaxID=2172824 RepID=UPI0012BD0A26|nr:type II toxin-antitoxin system HicB family antitoxin [Sansalvadorimonas verongulae]MTI11887.1 type II toxin-antitoxin system HicB family antitoxin [Sansalvadorimonas verongulae]
MTYKGYAATIYYSGEDECFIGHITGTEDCIGFHGGSIPELEEAFSEAVDDYLMTCEHVGKFHKAEATHHSE